MASILFIIALLVVGRLLAMTGRFPENAPQSLNQYVIHVALPALVFYYIHPLELSVQLWVPVAIPWLLVLLMAPLIVLLGRWLRFSRATTGCLLLLALLGNTSFVGIPLVSAYFGEAAISYAVLYDQLGSFWLLSIYGIVVVSIFASDSHVSWRAVVVKIVTFPPFLALVLALLLKPLTMPVELMALIKVLADTLVPVVLIALGMQFRFSLLQEDRLPLVLGLVIKLLVLPLVAWLILSLTGQSGLIANVTVFESGMAPMISAGVLATSANMRPRLVAALVGWGLLCSLITLWLWHQWLV